ncbi:hypothetical protein LTR36_004792 [Oleoguttula mirabilis]|uniref:DUF1772-domain-containing protein n=1 Tax=Oleoguttula mirabilis TaxID=1507867 RepID=A0AAV9JG17_9PEZI|nr:hypothetical protein LTR36_004792 [Oleoguttula mirabilis]
MAYTSAAQTISIATALIASGGILSLSLFDVPELQSQPADRALPSIRFLFSRGSHTFPQAATLSSAGFTYLAYTSLPAAQQSVTGLLKMAASGGKVSAYLAAAALAFSIAPWTGLMIPTNFALIQMNEDLGGAPSQAKADRSDFQTGGRSAKESVNSAGVVDELSDLSGPQQRTEKRSSAEDDRKVRELLTKFGRLNVVRAALIGAGGVVGLVAAVGA